MLGPIIEQRAAVEPDHVRELPGRRRRPVLRKADAAEEAQKIERLSKPISRSVSWSGKSSTRTTTPSHKRQKRAGSRANASSARRSRSASVGACRLAHASLFVTT